jgi:hypothetical protein
MVEVRALRDSRRMPPTSTCTCTRSQLTTVRFAHEVVLLRCARHEQQFWTVGGRPASASRAHDVLREVFVEGRARRGGRRVPSPRRGVQLVPPSPAPAATAQSLTALLNARGVEGSWAVA